MSLSIAPMIQWTDRYWRYMMRHITKETMLYTEMVMDQALVNNVHNLEDFIGFDAEMEPPLTVQLGGCNEVCSIPNIRLVNKHETSFFLSRFSSSIF